MRVPRLVRDNAFSFAFGAMFLATVVGQLFAGHHVYLDDLAKHGQAPMPLLDYARSGHFLEALAENWESEFLQMALFVVLSGTLRQKGAADSPEPDRDELASRRDAKAPWPVRRGGVALKLYEHSLSLALFALFAVSFLLHARHGQRMANAEAAQHGDAAMSFLQFVGSSELWFQSLQNWQSEFMSVFALALLSIVLREKGSPESKPVGAPHAQTGSEP
jgi:hypothetical protein